MNTELWADGATNLLEHVPSSAPEYISPQDVQGAYGHEERAPKYSVYIDGIDMTQKESLAPDFNSPVVPGEQGWSGRICGIKKKLFVILLIAIAILAFIFALAVGLGVGLSKREGLQGGAIEGVADVGNVHSSYSL